MKKFLFSLLITALVLFFAFGVQGNIASAQNDAVRLRILTRYPSPYSKPAATSNCTPTTLPDSENYKLAGWYMPSSGVNYKINLDTKPRNLTNNQVYAAISNSFVTWTSADHNQIFNYAGSTRVNTARFDGVNAILFKNLPGSAIAITYVWYHAKSGLLAEVDTVFNKNLKWSYTIYTGDNDCGGAAGTFDLQNIATHEFGHWIGLDDLYSNTDKDLTMYGYGETTELKKDSLGAGDINGALAVAP